MLETGGFSGNNDARTRLLIVSLHERTSTEKSTNTNPTGAAARRESREKEFWSQEPRDREKLRDKRLEITKCELTSE
jgi:hypothetical protein